MEDVWEMACEGLRNAPGQWNQLVQRMCLGFLEEPQEAGVGRGSYARDKDIEVKRKGRCGDSKHHVNCWLLLSEMSH